MTADTQTTSSAPRRSLVPQFSLRLLFVLVTFSAIGTAIWYRWPIVEKVDLHAQGVASSGVAYSPKDFRATRGEYTYHRGWGGTRVKHGWSREYNYRGQLVREELWCEGLQHGPFREWAPDDGIRVEGAYFNGLRDGNWRTLPTQQMVRTQTWKRGVPHGVWEIAFPGEAGIRAFEFRDGILIHVDGKPWPDPLGQKIAAGLVDDKRSARALRSDANCNFTAFPLSEATLELSDAHGMILAIDWKGIEEAGIAREFSITANFLHESRIPLSTALSIIFQPAGLVPDYRYGRAVICPAATASRWRDPTGATRLKPNPDSELADRLELPVTVYCTDIPPQRIVEDLARQTGVEIDLSALPATPATPSRTMSRSYNWIGLSLRNSLGIILEDARWQVHHNGELLVITPMQSSTVRQTSGGK